MTIRRVLAVSHEASLTGAPLVLAQLLEWWRHHTDVEVHVLLLADGPLRARFERIGPVTVLDEGLWSTTLGVVQRKLVDLGSRRAWKPVAEARLRPQLRHLRGFDLVYLNSLTSIGVLPYLPDRPRVVSHLHELQLAVRAHRPARDLDELRHGPDRWIAVSQAVRDMLVDELSIDPDRILLHHAFIDPARLHDRTVSIREVEHVRRSVGIPTDAPVVMGSGMIEWRKGPDLFVQLAAEVRRRSSAPVHFVWVGGPCDGPEWERLRSDLERVGADHVHFVGPQPDPLAWFSTADVFALTSREDPFPLVCLEHAAFGHPVVTYRNGGIAELLEAAGPAAAAGVVDHLDVAAMADAVVSLLGSEPLRTQVGSALRARVLAHEVVDAVAPRLVADLEALVAGDTPSQRPPSGMGG